MLKYSVGLDVSSKKIDGCFSVIDTMQKVTIKSTIVISNVSTPAITYFVDKFHFLDLSIKYSEHEPTKRNVHIDRAMARVRITKKQIL